MYFDLPSYNNEENFELDNSGNNDVEASDNIDPLDSTSDVTSEPGTCEGVKIDALVSCFGHTSKHVSQLIETISLMLETHLSIAIDLPYLKQ